MNSFYRVICFEEYIQNIGTTVAVDLDAHICGEYGVTVAGLTYPRLTCIGGTVICCDTTAVVFG